MDVQEFHPRELNAGEFAEHCRECEECRTTMLANLIPSAHKRRNPASNPKQQARSELTQCQTCWKSKADGAVLFKCSACKVDLYCSKECQKTAWPTHKVKCKINQRVSLNGKDVSSLIGDLRGFTSKHRPSIAMAGVRALELVKDLSRCKRDLLVLSLISRPGRTRTETAFFAMEASVKPYSFFQEKGVEMLEQLAHYEKENKRTGAVATLFVLLHCIDSGISNVAPVGVWRDVLDPAYRGDWEGELIRHLNEGIVL
ncbi:hypothetical protein EIP91_009597 [Steccherinum ochraceum]|uniref:MYND-type domain-containing protein n=1 Tax=Steccherinum ochraceum TaxID=92696 RepID=A0A4R0RP01_9APHY|nr:hypothetical protein EIP91_009597 [Steccherinum ochraceum]